MLTATKPKAKLSVAELSALYDRIYDIADRLLKKHNPCNIRTEGTKVSCTYRLCETRLCCGGCDKYWDKGCTVKALGCKLFLCGAVRNKILQKRFRKLREYGRTHLNFTYNDSNWGNQTFTYSAVDKYYTPKENWLKWLEKRNGR